MPLTPEQKYLLGLGDRPVAEASTTKIDTGERKFAINQQSLNKIASELIELKNGGKSGSLSKESIDFIRGVLPDAIRKSLLELEDDDILSTTSYETARKGRIRDVLDTSLFQSSGPVIRGLHTGPVGDKISVRDLDEGTHGMSGLVGDGAKIALSSRGLEDNIGSFFNKFDDAASEGSTPIQVLFHELTHRIDSTTPLNLDKNQYSDQYYIRANEILAELSSINALKKTGGITKVQYDSKMQEIRDRIGARPKRRR